MSGTGPGANSGMPATAQGIVADPKHLDGALLPILHALQEHFGRCRRGRRTGGSPTSSILSRAEVHGVISFYHDFRKGCRAACGQGLPRRGPRSAWARLPAERAEEDAGCPIRPDHRR